MASKARLEQEMLNARIETLENRLQKLEEKTESQ
jgi:BMFP domain-containing protein YqiC